jgi:uncharacterized protein
VDTRAQLDSADLLQKYRLEILRLAAKHGASNVRVFGSMARGEARPDSDVDFLVDFKSDYTFWDHIGLKQDLEDLLNRRVDVVLEKNLREEFRAYVLQDAVPL